MLASIIHCFCRRHCEAAAKSKMTITAAIPGRSGLIALCESRSNDKKLTATRKKII